MRVRRGKQQHDVSAHLRAANDDAVTRPEAAADKVFGGIAVTLEALYRPCLVFLECGIAMIRGQFREKRR